MNMIKNLHIIENIKIFIKLFPWFHRDTVFQKFYMRIYNMKHDKKVNELNI